MRIIIIVFLSAGLLSAMTLKLEDCIKIAENNNNDIKISERDRELSALGVKQSLNGFYGISGSGSYSLTGNDDDELSSTASASFGISGNISPYLFHNYIYSNISEKNTIIDHSDVMNTVRYRVINSFFQVLIADEKLKLQKDIAEYSEKKYEEAELKYDMGIISRSDLLNFEVSRSSDIIDLRSAGSDLRRKKQDLIYYMNYSISPDSIELTFSEDIENETLPDEKEMISEALENRPDIMIQKNYLKQQHLSLKMKYDNFLPSLTGNFSYDYQRTQDINYDGPLYPGDEETTVSDGISGRLTLSVNLNWSDMNGIDRSRVEVKRSELQLENKKSAVENEIKVVLLNLQEQFDNLELADKYVELAKENMELADKLFFIGDRSATDYLQARNDYINARYQRINTRYNYILTKYELYNSLGREL